MRPVLCIIMVCGLPEWLATILAFGKPGALHIRVLLLASFAAFFHISPNMEAERPVSLSGTESMISSCNLSPCPEESCLACCELSPCPEESCLACCELSPCLEVSSLACCDLRGKVSSFAKYRSFFPACLTSPTLLRHIFFLQTV